MLWKFQWNSDWSKSATKLAVKLKKSSYILIHYAQRSNNNPKFELKQNIFFWKQWNDFILVWKNIFQILRPIAKKNCDNSASMQTFHWILFIYLPNPTTTYNNQRIFLNIEILRYIDKLDWYSYLIFCAFCIETIYLKSNIRNILILERKSLNQFTA